MTLRVVINSHQSLFACNDRIFLGEGLIETIRVRNGKPCYANSHLKRLQDAAQFLQIRFKLMPEQWNCYLFESIKQANTIHGGIKVILSSGPAARGLIQQSCEPCLQINAFDYELPNAPIKLASASWLRDSQNPIYQIKSINYLEAIMALRYIKHTNADEVLFFNTEKQVTETSIANLFLVADDTLYTPDLSCGVLNGITRQRILNATNKLNFKFSETKISLAMLANADSVFLSNALQGIRTVSSLDNTYFFNTECILKNRLIDYLEEEVYE